MKNCNIAKKILNFEILNFRFDVMSHCWAELPANRPTFTKLRKRLGVLMDSVRILIQLFRQSQKYFPGQSRRLLFEIECTCKLLRIRK